MIDKIDAPDRTQHSDGDGRHARPLGRRWILISLLIATGTLLLGLSGAFSGDGTKAYAAARRTRMLTPSATAPARATATATPTPSRTIRARRTGTPAIYLTATSHVRRTATAQARATDCMRVTATAQAHETGESRVRRTATAESRATDEAVPAADVAFVADVTVPDNTELAPGETFDKTWRVRNAGSEAWPEADCLAFVSGERMDAATGDFVPVAGTGDEVDITMPMVAPEEPGAYTGTWQVVDGSGEPVGDQLLTIVIQVVGPTPSPTPSVDFVVVKQDVLPVFIDGGCNWQHNIYVTVIDKCGNPLDGLVIGDTYDNVELVTGSKGPGRCDFDLWANTLELYIKRDEAGTPYRSEVSRRLSSDHPEIGDMINGGVCEEEAECQDKLDRFSYCWGHYAYELVFQRTW